MYYLAGNFKTITTSEANYFYYVLRNKNWTEYSNKILAYYQASSFCFFHDANNIIIALKVLEKNIRTKLIYVLRHKNRKNILFLILNFSERILAGASLRNVANGYFYKISNSKLFQRGFAARLRCFRSKERLTLSIEDITS